MNPFKADAVVILLAAFVAITAAWFAGSLGLWLVGVAAIVFSVVMVLAMFVRQIELGRKIARLERGIVEYEASVGERFERASSDFVSKEEIDEFRQELQLERVKSSLSASAQRTRENRQENSDDTADGDKVIPFLRIVRDENEKKPVEKKTARKAQTFNKDSLVLYLQPIVSVEKRSTQAFEIVPGITDENDVFIPLSEKPEILKRNISPARRDLILMEATFDLLRSLDLDETDVKFNLPISGASIESKKLFKEFLRLLKLHDRFGGTLFISIEQKALDKLNSAAQTRLVEANDAGFGLIISECQSISAALLAISENRASGMAIDISMLTDNDNSITTNQELDLATQAAQSGVPLIVTNVAIEAQVMELLDRSIELAVGPYFSEPKAPKTGLRGTEPVLA